MKYKDNYKPLEFKDPAPTARHSNQISEQSKQGTNYIGTTWTSSKTLKVITAANMVIVPSSMQDVPAQGLSDKSLIVDKPVTVNDFLK